MFDKVKRFHIIAACKQIIREGYPANRAGKSTFIRFEGVLLPAKYVLGTAYELANKEKLEPNDFHGGEASAKILEQNGFEVVKKIRSEKVGPNNKSANKSKKAKSDTGKAGLFAQLKKHFGRVESEKSFPWLLVPKHRSLPSSLGNIRNTLSAYRGHKNFDTPGYPLKCDFYLPEHSLIIEVDERQHFTFPRQLALKNYPNNIRLGFNQKEWITSCSRISASDSDPIYRDEQRAYYDSLRDILAPENGLQPVIRIAETDINTAQGIQNIINLIESHLGLKSQFTGANKQLNVVTVCVEGDTAQAVNQNVDRVDLLHCVSQALVRREWYPDVIVLPGGFFKLPQNVGPLDYKSRIDFISKQSFSKSCLSVSNLIGAVLVAGVDGAKRYTHKVGVKNLSVNSSYFPPADDGRCQVQ